MGKWNPRRGLNKRLRVKHNITSDEGISFLIKEFGKETGTKFKTTVSYKNLPPKWQQVQFDAFVIWFNKQNRNELNKKFKADEKYI